MEHGEDGFPIAVGGLLVVHVAPGQPIAVDGAHVALPAVFRRPAAEHFAELVDGRGRRERVILREAEVDLAAELVSDQMRRRRIVAHQ